MSEPLKTPPGQLFGVLFLSLALIVSVLLCFDLVCCAPNHGCGRADGGRERLFREPGESLIRLSGSSVGIRAEVQVVKQLQTSPLAK